MKKVILIVAAFVLLLGCQKDKAAHKCGYKLTNGTTCPRMVSVPGYCWQHK